MEVETRTNIILLYERPPMAKQSFRYRKDGIRYQPKEVQEERAKIIELTKRQIPSDYISLEKKEGNGIIISFTFYFDPPTQLKKHIKQLLMGNKEVFRNRRPDDDKRERSVCGRRHAAWPIAGRPRDCIRQEGCRGHRSVLDVRRRT